MTISNPLRTLLATLIITGLGCSGPEKPEVEAKRPKKSIFKQRTQEVGEFDPKAGKVTPVGRAVTPALRAQYYREGGIVSAHRNCDNVLSKKKSVS